MLWVIERLQYLASKQMHFIDALKSLNCRFVQVDVQPFTHKVTPLPKSDQSIVAMGSTLLVRAARTYQWAPGVWLTDQFRFEHWREHYQSDLLNIDAHIQKFSEIEFEGTAFIRPCEDLKAFSGTLVEDHEIQSWKEKTVSYADSSDSNLISADTLVVVAPVKSILKEYRFFVVNGKVVTGCQYRIGSRHVESIDVPDSVKEYAQTMVNIWSPAFAFVIDIAETSAGLKVIEINNFNGAGLYVCDVHAIIQAVETNLQQ